MVEGTSTADDFLELSKDEFCQCLPLLARALTSVGTCDAEDSPTGK